MHNMERKKYEECLFIPQFINGVPRLINTQVFDNFLYISSVFGVFSVHSSEFIDCLRNHEVFMIGVKVQFRRVTAAHDYVSSDAVDLAYNGQVSLDTVRTVVK